MTLREMGDRAGAETAATDALAGAAAGERAALRRVLRDLAPAVLSTARRVLGSRSVRGHDAEDVTQETLVIVARKVGELRDPAAILAYARRTAARRALRLRSDADRDLARLVARGPTREADGDLTREAEARSRADLLVGLMASLSEVQAETMVLRFALGMSLQEVADAMSTSPNTVRSRVRLARERMGEMLERRPELRAALEGT